MNVDRTIIQNNECICTDVHYSSVDTNNINTSFHNNCGNHNKSNGGDDAIETILPTVSNYETDSLEINPIIYRYKFTQCFMDELYQFSKIHQYDDRSKFKESWKLWCEDNHELIAEEITRLTTCEYKGNILDKMFKSARYYFRKKSITKIEPRIRRNYVGVQKQILDAIDRHIFVNIQRSDYKPSDGFTDFCNSQVELLKNEVKNLITNGIKDPSEIRDKIKKTYKNRYFLLIHKMQS